MKLKAFILPVVAILGVAGYALLNKAPETGAAYTLDREPEVVAATFASAWCSACKILEPRLAAVIPAFKDEPVKFVKFDFTFGQRAELIQQAEAEGLGAVYPLAKGATGFTLLVDRDSGKIIDTLTIKNSKNAMRDAIARAIAIAERDDAGVESGEKAE